MRIALDAMGGDFAPKEIVQGAVLAVQDPENLSLAQNDLEVLLVGRKEDIERDIASQAPRKPSPVKADEYRPASRPSQTESEAPDTGGEETSLRKRRVKSKEQETENAGGETAAEAGNQ